MFTWLANLFTKHPSEQGEIYKEHAIFALRLALRFLTSGLCLTLHAFFPFICPPKPYDLRSMTNYLNEKCEQRKEIKHDRDS